MSARLLVGPVQEVVADLEDGSIDLVLTSPPFFLQRSYLPNDDPMKPWEIGAEATPGGYIDHLLDLVEALEPKLTRWGTIAIELGDTYAGSGGAGGDYDVGGLREGQPRWEGSASRRKGYSHDGEQLPAGEEGPRRLRTRRHLPGYPLDKSLMMLPETLRWAMAYGHNPLTGRETSLWRVRNVVRWARPNPTPGSLGDKVRPATTEMLVACKDRRRWFDLAEVRTPLTSPDQVFAPKLDRNPSHGWGQDAEPFMQNPAGAPPNDWWLPLEEELDLWQDDLWVIAPAPYRGQHYATWPPALCVRPIESMCPRRVCRTCGEPSRRIEAIEESPFDPEDRVQRADGDAGRRAPLPNGRTHQGINRVAETTGWTDCGHDDWRPGIVLDPFCGTGTTLMVATGHGRDAIGIDLDARNAELVEQRVGMWLEQIDNRMEAKDGREGDG